MTERNHPISMISVWRRRGLWEVVLIPIVLPGILAVFFGKFLRGGYSVANYADNTHFLLPLFAHISKSFAGGHFPYWINSIAGGIPLYNNPQFSILYPFYFFRLNLYRTPLDAAIHVHYVTLLHVAILWLSTYIMMRIFHLRIISSVLGATLFAFCANTYVYFFWLNIISPYSWFPMALGSVFLILENEYPKTGLVLGWTSTYLLVSASPAQALIHLLYCTAFLAISYAVTHPMDKAGLILRLRNLALMTLGGILLSSATLIPTGLFSRGDMVRWTEVGPIVGNQRIPFKGFLTGQANVRELANVLFPLNIDFVTGESYLGIVVIFLALFAFCRARQNWLIVPLFVLALYTLLSSTGSNLGLAYINYRIPLWNKIREPARHLYLFGLATCTLAGFGFEHFTIGKWLRRSNIRKQGLMFIAFLILVFASYCVRQRYESRINDSTLAWSFGLFLVALAGYSLLGRQNRPAQALLAAIAIYPSLAYAPPISRLADNDYFAEANLRSHRVLRDLSNVSGIDKYRLIVSDDKLTSGYWSMNGAYYGLRTFDAFMNPVPFRETAEMFTARESFPYAQLLGAKYYLRCGEPQAVPEGFSIERETEGCRLYSSARAQPYYFLSTEIGRSYTDSRQFLEMMQLSDADPSKISIATPDVPTIAEWLEGETPRLNAEVFREEHATNSFDLGLRTNRRAILVLNEYFRDEWLVTLNGKRTEPFKANLNQIGVLLPDGSNQIHFEYRPRLFIGLLYVQWIAFALLIAAAGYMAFTEMKKVEI